MGHFFISLTVKPPPIHRRVLRSLQFLIRKRLPTSKYHLDTSIFVSRESNVIVALEFLTFFRRGSNRRTSVTAFVSENARNFFFSLRRSSKP